MLRWLGVLTIGGLVGTAILVAPGFLLEGPQSALQPSDAIVVISGDEAQARLREGVRLYRDGWAPTIIFSGAARSGDRSNAEAMRSMAIADGVPPTSILVDEVGVDTYGNALETRALMLAHGLRSAILVTSPYHLHRAALTFEAVYRGTGIQLIGRSAPDGDWRKTSWWQREDTRAITLRELEKLGYVTLTGRFN